MVRQVNREKRGERKVTKKSQSTFNWYTAEDILANGSFEEMPNIPSEQTRSNSAPTAKQYPKHTQNNSKDITKIDWQIVEDILIDEMFNELPVLSFEQPRPALTAFANRYPNYENAKPEDILKAYFCFLTRKNIRLTNFLDEGESLGKIATVTPMFHVVKSVLEDIGITFDLILDRKKVTIDKIMYLGRSDSATPLKEETIIVFNRIGCNIKKSHNKKIKFTHPTIIKWFNKTIYESLLFNKEKAEETLQNIVNNTIERMENEFIYLID